MTVTATILDDGRPIVVAGRDDRIGAGPWARWFAGAVIPDESTARAERGRALARAGAVHTVALGEGSISAVVVGSTGVEYDVSITAPTVPASVWARATRAARGRPQLEAAVEGRAQSVHLAHDMANDHGEALVLPAAGVRRSCTCPDTERVGACKHVAALAFVVADAIDRDPALFLRFRGCAVVEPSAARSDDPWAAGTLPEARPLRALPAGAVVKRLGRSGIRIGGADLADALAPAYEAFAAVPVDRA